MATDGTAKKPPVASREAPLRGFLSHSDAPSSRVNRLNLPPELDAVFEQVRELSTAGGQATLLLCRRRDSDDELVAVKLYDKPAKIGQEDLRPLLQGLGSPDIVKYREPFFGSHDGYWWEVFEYCTAGSLRDFADAQGGTIDFSHATDVVRQMHEAFSSIHAATPQIVHRDIKPDNILLRSADPLDIVLIDFGFAVEVVMSREYRSGSRTVPYAAPEAIGGETGSSLDWWGLGMTLLEMLSGQHPFRLPGGQWLSEAKINSHLSSRPIPIPTLGDERFELLLRGLLTRDPSSRWGLAQVGEWLEGGKPDVATDEAVTLAVASSASATAAATRPGPEVRPVEFATALFTDPVVLAEAMATRWNEAGRKVVSATFHEIVDWAEEFFPERSLARIAKRFRDRNDRVDYTVAQVIVTLDPGINPTFMGERVDMEALPSLVAGAVNEGGARIGLVEKLFLSKALRAFGQLEAHRDLLLVDTRWTDHTEQAQEWFQKVPEAGGFKPEHYPLFLLSAVEDVRKLQSG